MEGGIVNLLSIAVYIQNRLHALGGDDMDESAAAPPSLYTELYRTWL